MFTPERPSYFLAPHVHTCRTESGAVFLDLRRDRYFGIGSAQAAALAGWIDGWPAVSIGQTVEPDHATAEQLVNAGLLTVDSRIGRTAAPIALLRPTSALIEGYIPVTPGTGWKDVLIAVRSILRARRLLRHSLERATSRIADGAGMFSAGLENSDHDELRCRVADFRRLRTLFFSAHNACVLDSLALAQYLARYGFRPACVFGVRTQPFMAHCWLQHGTVVINDTPQNVGNYTPILVVPEPLAPAVRTGTAPCRTWR